MEGEEGDTRQQPHARGFEWDPATLQATPMRAAAMDGGATGSGAGAIFCQVHGCNADLTSLRYFFRKQRICEQHARANVVTDGTGRQLRFCQQCTRLEPLSRFSGSRRSCKASLAKRQLRTHLGKWTRDDTPERGSRRRRPNAKRAASLESDGSDDDDDSASASGGSSLRSGGPAATLASKHSGGGNSSGAAQPLATAAGSSAHPACSAPLGTAGSNSSPPRSPQRPPSADAQAAQQQALQAQQPAQSAATAQPLGQVPAQVLPPQQALQAQQSAQSATAAQQLPHVPALVPPLQLALQAHQPAQSAATAQPLPQVPAQVPPPSQAPPLQQQADRQPQPAGSLHFLQPAGSPHMPQPAAPPPPLQQQSDQQPQQPQQAKGRLGSVQLLDDDLDKLLDMDPDVLADMLLRAPTEMSSGVSQGKHWPPPAAAMQQTGGQPSPPQQPQPQQPQPPQQPQLQQPPQQPPQPPPMPAAAAGSNQASPPRMPQQQVPTLQQQAFRVAPPGLGSVAASPPTFPTGSRLDTAAVHATSPMAVGASAQPASPAAAGLSQAASPPNRRPMAGQALALQQQAGGVAAAVQQAWPSSGLVRFSLKVFGATPEHLPPSLRNELLMALQVSPTVLEGAVRIGCTHLIVDVLLSQQEHAQLATAPRLAAAVQRMLRPSNWQTLPAPPAMAAQLESLVAQGTSDACTAAPGSSSTLPSIRLGSAPPLPCLSLAGPAATTASAAAGRFRLRAAAPPAPPGGARRPRAAALAAALRCRSHGRLVGLAVSVEPPRGRAARRMRGSGAGSPASGSGSDMEFEPAEAAGAAAAAAGPAPAAAAAPAAPAGAPQAEVLDVWAPEAARPEGWGLYEFELVSGSLLSQAQPVLVLPDSQAAAAAELCELQEEEEGGRVPPGATAALVRAAAAVLRCLQLRQAAQAAGPGSAAAASFAVAYPRLALVRLAGLARELVSLAVRARWPALAALLLPAATADGSSVASAAAQLDALAAPAPGMLHLAAASGADASVALLRGWAASHGYAWLAAGQAAAGSDPAAAAGAAAGAPPVAAAAATRQGQLLPAAAMGASFSPGLVHERTELLGRPRLACMNGAARRVGWSPQHVATPAGAIGVLAAPLALRAAAAGPRQVATAAYPAAMEFMAAMAAVEFSEEEVEEQQQQQLASRPKRLAALQSGASWASNGAADGAEAAAPMRA